MRIPLILALSYVLFVSGLGATSLWDPDEPRQAITAREMIERNDYIRPYLNGKPYLEKPPLYSWLIIAAAKIQGRVDEFSSRIPAALSATCLVVITYWFGSILVDPFTGFLSALTLATNFQFLGNARQSVMDMTFAFFIGLTIFLCYLAMAHKKPRYIVLSFLPAALATLTKGPAGLVIPMGVVAVYCLIRKELRRFLLPLGIGFVTSAALASIWFFLAGEAYWKEFILRQNFVRYMNAFDHKESCFYYFEKIFTNFLPWSLLLPFALFDAFKKKFWLPLVWLTITFLFFEFSTSKRAIYLLPLYPACALLCGRYMREKWQDLLDSTSTNLLLRFFAFLFVLLPCASIVIVRTASTPDLMAFAHDQATYYGGGALVLVGALLFFALAKRNRGWSLIALFLYVSLAGFFYHASYLTFLDKTSKSPRLITETVQEIKHEGNVALCGFNSPGVIFYLGKPVETFYGPDVTKQSKNNILLVVKVEDNFPKNLRQELQERFTPVRNVRYRGTDFTLFKNKNGY